MGSSSTYEIPMQHISLGITVNHPLVAVYQCLKRIPRVIVGLESCIRGLYL